jgi:hypothetical protein
LNYFKNGVKFHFIDKYLVRYRVGEGGLSTSNKRNLDYIVSLRKAYFYYVFQERFASDPEKVVNEIVDYEMNLRRDVDVILHSPSYRLGCALLKPLKWIRSKMSK